jgi:hypothetical protein
MSKLGIVEEEADETLFRLELAIEVKLVPEQKLGPLMQEAEELLKITLSSINTARKQNRNAESRAPGSEASPADDKQHSNERTKI